MSKPTQISVSTVDQTSQGRFSAAVANLAGCQYTRPRTNRAIRWLAAANFIVTAQLSLLCHSREGGSLELVKTWIPASAGMTVSSFISSSKKETYTYGTS